MECLINISTLEIKELNPYSEITTQVKEWLNNNNVKILDIDDPIESYSYEILSLSGDDTFKKPIFRQLTIEEGKKLLNELINTERDKKCHEKKFTDSNGHNYDIDVKSRDKITGMVASIANNIITENFIWRDADNIDRTHTPITFLTLSSEILQYTQHIYSISWQKKSEVNNLSTINELKSYDITTGWD